MVGDSIGQVHRKQQQANWQSLA